MKKKCFKNIYFKTLLYILYISCSTKKKKKKTAEVNPTQVNDMYYVCIQISNVKKKKEKPLTQITDTNISSLPLINTSL